MERHLRLVPAGTELLEPDLDTDEVLPTDGAPRPDTNVVDLDDERARRRYRFHPAAGPNWLDDLFDGPDDDDFPPAC